MEPKAISMRNSTLSELKPLRTVFYPDSPINGLEFSDDGSLLMVSTENKTLDIYDVLTFSKDYSINISENGACCPKFFATNQDGLHGTTKKNQKTDSFDILLFDLFSLSYKNRFIGSQSTQTEIVRRPGTTNFFSSDNKGLLTEWDVRQNSPVVRLNVDGGIQNRKNDYVGVTVESNNVLCLTYDNQFYLYDGRNLKEYFAHSQVVYENDENVNSLKFSPCEKFVTFMTDKHSIITLDSFDLVEKAKISVDEVNTPSKLGWDFSPCGRYIISANSNSEINLYSIISGELISSKPNKYKHNPTNINFNKKYFVTAIGGDYLSMWTP
uniref:WD_REPEATS_REGION domain-containing protein n=1 Tax=Parastrongyloides trichosuri TaxID=131310 RepID=A0A0N4ZTI1_PARTI